MLRFAPLRAPLKTKILGYAFDLQRRRVYRQLQVSDDANTFQNVTARNKRRDKANYQSIIGSQDMIKR